jgi:hypothetical protein
MGFNIHNPTAKEFLDQYISASELGVSSPYNGDWSNNNLEVSNDMRVKGHRHDQSVASVLAEQMNIPIINAQSTFFAYESHKGIVPVSNNVCLWSGGI